MHKQSYVTVETKTL